MDKTANPLDRLDDVPISVAFTRWQGALTEHIEDMNRRFNAGLSYRQTPISYQVHELEKADTLVSLDLTDKNDIEYCQFIKRDHEMRSGMIFVRVCQDGPPALMFQDFPHPNVQLSYQDASKRLLDSSF